MRDSYKKTSDLIHANSLEDAILFLEGEFNNIPQNDFHKILELDFLPLLEPLLDCLNRFYKSATKSIGKVAAIYCEMNAFTINHDAWAVDIFAYSNFGGEDDYDWLADPDFTDFDQTIVFTKLQELQAIFRDYIEKQKSKDEVLEKSFGVAELLIIVKVQQLFRQTCLLAKRRRLVFSKIPLLITAHDYDLVYNASQK